MGEAYRREGDEEAARLELDSAKAAFEHLGALPDARRSLLGEDTGGCPGRRAGQENIRIHRHCGVHPPGRGAG